VKPRLRLRLQELVSAHGFSDNQLTVWRYPSLQPIATLTGQFAFMQRLWSALFSPPILPGFALWKGLKTCVCRACARSVHRNEP
jgi:hypothetical protein